MKTALILGRFQPVHNGHLSLIEQTIKQGVKRLLIGICTKPKDVDNPFSYEIRKEMIKGIVKDVIFTIQEIHDIHDPNDLEYQKHVSKLIPEFDSDTIIVSRNKYTLDCFPDNPKFKPVLKEPFNGTDIRKGMTKYDMWCKIPKDLWEMYGKYNLIEKMERDKFHEVLDITTIYEGKYATFDNLKVKLPNGHITNLNVVTPPTAVAILPVTSDNQILLTRQLRPAVCKYILEIPAGIMDKENEMPIDTARRELEEEVGVKGKLTKICNYHPSAGFCNYEMTIYYANITEFTKQKLDDSEILTVIKIPIQEAYAMVLDGKISDAKTQIAIRHYYNEVLK